MKEITKAMRYIDFLGGFTLGLASMMLIIYLVTTLLNRCITPVGVTCT